MHQTFASAMMSIGSKEGGIVMGKKAMSATGGDGSINPWKNTNAS